MHGWTRKGCATPDGAQPDGIDGNIFCTTRGFPRGPEGRPERANGTVEKGYRDGCALSAGCHSVSPQLEATWGSTVTLVLMELEIRQFASALAINSLALAESAPGARRILGFTVTVVN